MPKLRCRLPLRRISRAVASLTAVLPPLLLLPLAPQSSLAAQAPADPAAAHWQHVAGVVHDPAGTPWAVGVDYKAALRPGGIDFVPALPAAPTNRVLSLRLAQVRRGEQLLHTAATGEQAPRPSWQGTDVAYAHGGIVERYRVAPRGMELSYVFADRPLGDGDLVVRCAVGGGLRGEALDDGTLRFGDGQFGGVHIGHVTGIDAAGARCRGSLGIADGQLELRLPDAFVDGAKFPLVLDPWLATAALVPQNGGNDSFATGLTSAGGFAAFTTWVWCRTFSASDSDVYAVNSNSQQTLLGIANAANLVETAPVVGGANVWQPIVWQEGPAANGPWTLKARPFFVSQGLPLQPVTTLAVGGERPSVCSRRDAGLTGLNSVLVSYVEPGVGLRVRSFTAPTTVGAAQTVVPLNNGSSIVGTPRFSDSYTATAPAALIYEIVPAISPNAHTLNVLAIDSAAQLAGSVNLVTANGIDFDPAIAGNGDHFLAAFTRFGQLQQVRITRSGTTLTASPPALFDTVRGKRPAMGWCADRYLVAWGRSTAVAGDDEIVVGTYTPSGSQLRPLEVLPTVAQPNQQQPAIVSGFAVAGNPLRAVVTWIETPASGGGSGTACTRTFATMQGGTPQNLGGSCLGNSCTSLLPCGYTQGNFAPGSQNFQIRLQYQDQSAAFAVLNFGLGLPAPIGCGACQYMPPLASVVVPNAPGELVYPWALPFDYSLLGVQLQFQWLMLGTTASPCGLAPNVTAYNRVSITFAE